MASKLILDTFYLKFKNEYNWLKLFLDKTSEKAFILPLGKNLDSPNAVRAINNQELQVNGTAWVIEWRSEMFALNKSLIEIWSLVLLSSMLEKRSPI
jgi:hypothetical protein